MKKYSSLLFGIIATATSFAQAATFDSLDINNVIGKFYANGRLEDFEITQGSGQSTLYAGHLWMGGLDPNGQLKLAADQFQSGDFFYGPAALGYSSGNQSGYNRVWKVSQQEIVDFNLWYQCYSNPFCAQNPAYSIPDAILNWPAHGDVNQGQNYYLAPFEDNNQDGIYNPYDGDYPCIKGDMAILTLFNDIGPHTNSNGSQIGVEVMAMHYGFASDPSNTGNNAIFQNTIFSEYNVINTSDTTLTDFYLGIWEDNDIGCSDNDYVGCEVARGLTYTQNADTIDLQNNDPCSGPFGLYPPAQGTAFLKGLKVDHDGIDNPLTTDIPTAVNQNGIPYEGLGCGYGDGMIDNEYKGLSGFMYFDRSLPSIIYGSPVFDTNYYDYLNGKWSDGTELFYGGTGHTNSNGATTTNANYVYPGTSDPLYWSTSGVIETPADWSETSPWYASGDRRTISTMGPITFQARTQYEFTIAHITARDTTGAQTSLEVLFNSTDVIRDYYACQENIFRSSCSHYTLSIEKPASFEHITLYPNPTNGWIQLDAPKNIQQLTVYNLAGQIIEDITDPDIRTLNLSGFDAGVYLVELQIDGNRIVKRVVKE